jgi:hypothetical protein
MGTATLGAALLALAAWTEPFSTDAVRGDVVVEQNDIQITFTGALGSTCAAAFAVLTDPDVGAGLLPDTVSVVVQRRALDNFTYHRRLGGLPFFDAPEMTAEAHVERLPDGALRITHRRLAGNVPHFRARFTLTDTGQPKAPCRLTAVVVARPPFVPPRFLVLQRARGTATGLLRDIDRAVAAQRAR